MGCAPSAATGRSSSRLSNADDAAATAAAAAGGGGGGPVVDYDGMPAASHGGPSRGSIVGSNVVKPRENGDASGIKGSSHNDLFFGMMPFKQAPMSVLLVFSRNDSQSEALERAAEAGHYEANVVRTVDAALKSYADRRHAVVFVDTRPAAVNSGLDAETLCRSKPKEESSILPLLKAGYNRQFVENPNASICLAELQSIEHNDFRLQCKLKAAQALQAAVDNSNDAVEITDENHQIQYVNATYERMLGYKCDELLGKNCRDLTTDTDTTRAEIDTITAQLRAGRTWDGAYHMRRKTGENVWQKCRMIPIVGHSGKIRHFVAIRSQSNSERRGSNTDMSNGIATSHAVVPFNRQRKESMSRIPSMSIEAPITKVINMICQIREDSPPNFALALDNILEELRSSELYAPHLLQQVREDRVVSDLVGGLITMDEDVRSFKKVSMVKRGSCNSDTPLLLPRTHSSLTQPSEEVQKLLEAEADWGFNIIQLEIVTKKSPLVHLAMKTLQRFDVLDYLHIEEDMMFAWLQLMESNYHADNPYHNSTHAADVMHATAFFLSCDKLKVIFDEKDEIAALLAAIVHDLDHPGKTNNYLINAGSGLALLYNDLAVLESHHISLAFKLTTRDDKVNIFKNLPRDDYRSVRQMMVDMVLATEMTKHFEHLNRFVSVINQPATADDDILSSPGSGSSTSERRLSMSAKLAMPENKILIRRMLIKCADVSNPARPLEMCKEWAIRIANEYFQQTDDEKSQGLPVLMPVFDRTTCSVPKSQMGFIDFFINDMFDAWSTFCCLPDMVNNIKSNYAYWKQQESLESQKTAETLSRNFAAS